VARVVDDAPDFDEPGTVDEVRAAESWARQRTREIILSVGGTDVTSRKGEGA
jgi:1-deoxy-D-xylulose-5-phosphate reductoisomerase